MKIAKTIFGLLLSVLLMPTNSNSQTSFLGFRGEPFMFFSKTEGTGPFAYKHKDEVGVYLTSFLLTHKLQLSDFFSLNTRVGYLWTTEDRINGIQIGEYLQYNLSKRTYIISGIQIHLNQENFVREFHIEDVAIPSLVLGPGINISQTINIELQYMFPLKSEYRTSSFNGPVSYKLSGMLKISVGFDWKL